MANREIILTMEAAMQADEDVIVNRGPVFCEGQVSALEMSLACHLVPNLSDVMHDVRMRTVTTRVAATNVVGTSSKALESYSTYTRIYLRAMIISMVRVPLSVAAVLRHEAAMDRGVQTDDIVALSCRSGWNALAMMVFSDVGTVPRVTGLAILSDLGNMIEKVGPFRAKLEMVLVAIDVMKYISSTEWLDAYELKTLGETRLAFKEGALGGRARVALSGNVAVVEVKLDGTHSFECCKAFNSCSHWNTRIDLLNAIPLEAVSRLGA